MFAICFDVVLYWMVTDAFRRLGMGMADASDLGLLSLVVLMNGFAVYGIVTAVSSSANPQ